MLKSYPDCITDIGAIQADNASCLRIKIVLHRDHGCKIKLAEEMLNFMEM
jgi:hypothetical protein